MCGARSQAQSPPPRPLSRGALCPWNRRARHAFLLPASLCLSSPDRRGRPQAGRDAAGGFQRHSRRPEARGDPPGGWAAFRRPRALLSAPRFLPRKRRGRMSGPPQRPRALSPGYGAAFSSGCGFCCSGRGERQRTAWAHRVPGSSQQPPAGPGVRRRPEGAAASHSPAHTL